jgi:hypothetical protein
VAWAASVGIVLVGAAVCPHPPLLVPELAAGAAAELDDLRHACVDAIGRLAATGAAIHVVGADTGERAGSFGPWGVDVAVDVAGRSPLPHLVAAWLLTEAGARAAGWHLVAPDAPPADCLATGRRLATAQDVALLVMGDGAARHSEKAPGYLDPRAADWDKAAATAFAEADPAALAALDPALGADLLAAGRAPWQVLAGAADDGRTRSATAKFCAPYGVGYHVVTWQ